MSLKGKIAAAGGLCTHAAAKIVSARPDTDDTVLSALDEVAVFDSHTLDCRGLRCSISRDASTAVPMPSVRLVVDFSDIFPCCSYNMSHIKCHTRDRVVISIGVIN